MKDSITRCQICKKIVTLEKNSKTEKVENVNGVSWPDFVYSPRGWGRAQVAVNAFRGEICDDCFIPIINCMNLMKLFRKGKISVKTQKGYVFTKHHRSEQVGIKCLQCNLTSYNPNDIQNLYCGCCHIFHEPNL